MHGRQTLIKAVCTLICAHWHALAASVSDKRNISLAFFKNLSRTRNIWIQFGLYL